MRATGKDLLEEEKYTKWRQGGRVGFLGRQAWELHSAEGGTALMLVL